MIVVSGEEWACGMWQFEAPMLTMMIRMGGNKKRERGEGPEEFEGSSSCRNGETWPRPRGRNDVGVWDGRHEAKSLIMNRGESTLSLQR